MLALPQSGRTPGNHQGGGKKALRKFTFPQVVIDEGKRRRGSRERERAPGAMAQVVISKLVKWSMAGSIMIADISSDVLVVLFGRC